MNQTMDKVVVAVLLELCDNYMLAQLKVMRTIRNGRSTLPLEVQKRFIKSVLDRRYDPAHYPKIHVEVVELNYRARAQAFEWHEDQW